MSDHGGTFTTFGPVAAGGVLVAGGNFAVRCGAGQDVMHVVRRFSAAVDLGAFLGQRGHAVDTVQRVQFIDVARDQASLETVPRPLADTIAGIDGRRITARGCAQISAPLFFASIRHRGELLAMLVGAGESAEIGTLAQTGAGHEKRHVGRDFLRLRRSHRHQQCNR